MYYLSTRDKNKSAIPSSQAIANGLSADGGLYVPTDFPRLPFDDYIGLSYEEIALNVLGRYFSDFSREELKEYIHKAYSEGNNLPVKLNGDYLELFHGNTASFKDMALQLFPYLLSAALRKNNIDKTAVIITATSGDTGPAVLSGMANIPNIRAIVFYPHNGVTSVQRLQMTTQEGDNLFSFGINGNFDDAQAGVKEIFADEAFKAQFADEYIFTSANSINIGRLLPQIVHFFYAYTELVRGGRIGVGEKINFAVPTGNFGNILSAYYAKKMGLPINKLVCATNTNRVLDEFFKTGKFDSNRKFELTISPAIDILVPSNFERYMYENIAPLDIVADFASDCASDQETIETMQAVYKSQNYIIDPHTAVAKCVYDKYQQRTGDKTLTIIASTASPYKFTETVVRAIGDDILTAPPSKIAALKDKPILHDKVIDIKNMRKAISEILGGVLS